MKANTFRYPPRLVSVILTFMLAFLPLHQLLAQAPVTVQTSTEPGTDSSSPVFQLERTNVNGGAELITIKANLSGLASEKNDSWVPLVSILRDTLGDESPENDQLRYVWPLAYTSPTLKQRLAAAVPFLYTRVGNKKSVSTSPPSPVFDLAKPENDVWKKLFWAALQNVLFDPYGTPIKASTSSYQRNIGDYRKSHIIRALTVLALFQQSKGERAFSDSEMAEIQARLMLTDKTFGGLVDYGNLNSYYARKTAEARDERGHNWELLRQKAEAESLYFQPLSMPDGTSTHALIWVSKDDVSSHQPEDFDGRFLNIAKPWGDKRLSNWKGYTETRYFNSDGEIVSNDTPGAHALQLIPLALYGLDHPKIPMLLVDFRDGLNPKKREMSRRVLNDVTRNILSVSKFGSLPFLLGKTVYDFVTGRRGLDINQPSRLRAYSQLKLLLALNNSIETPLRNEVNNRLERISLNPFENDMKAEATIAIEQYNALIAFAKDPEGLSAKVERDRRAEMTALQHGRKAQLWFDVANALSFGKYVHRESATEDLQERLDISRRLDYHSKFLEEVAKSRSEIDVAWNLDDVKRALQFVAEHGTDAGNNVIAAAAKIFARTKDDDTRRACLYSLSRISSSQAKNELQRISQNTNVENSYREVASNLLQQRGERIEPVASTVRDVPAKAGQP